MCNKCKILHSQLLEQHSIYNLNEGCDNEAFINFCNINNHHEIFEFFCKNHNQLCCAYFICKFKYRIWTAFRLCYSSYKRYLRREKK